MAQVITGIDIGQVSLSAVTLRRHGAAVEVLSHATVSRYAANGSKKPLSTALAELAQSSPFKGKVVLAASQLAVLIRLIGTIPMPADRLERLLRLELSQHADEHGDLAADYTEVPLLVGDEVIQCCCIGQVGPMRDFLKELAAADCKPDRVQAPALALGNVLSLNEFSEDNSFGLLADIGAKSTRLVLRRGTAVLAAREVSMGGDDFTEALAKSKEIQFERAEVLKQQRSSSFADEQDTPYQASVTRSVSAPPLHDTPVQEIVEEHASPDFDDLFDLDDQTGPSAGEGKGGDALTSSIQASTEAGDVPAEDSDSKDSDTLDFDAIDEAVVTQADASAEDSASLFAETDDLFPSDNSPRSEEPTSDSFWLRSDNPNENPTPELERPGRGTQIIGRTDLGPELSAAAEALAGQISASLAWFRSQLKLNSIELQHIELCGGGSLLEGLPAYLARRLRAPVSLWQTPRSLQGAQGKAIPPLALGLALSGGPHCPDLDMRPESFRYQQQWRQEVLWFWVSAVVILVAAVIFLVGHLMDQRYYNSEISAFKNHEQRYQQEQQRLSALRDRREDLAQDVRGIASRVFAGRDLLYVIRSLKQAAKDHQDLWVAEFRTESVAGEAETVVANRSGRNNRGDSREKVANHNDTSIDRGKLYVRVVIRRDDRRDAQAYERIFRDWLAAVMQWKRPDNKQPLFSDYRQTEVPSESDQFEYEVRFDFLATDLRNELP